MAFNHMWWVQNVLPLTFDNSLSYYEVLAKITHYLNNLSEDVSNVIKTLGTIEGIQDVEAYTQFLESIQSSIGSLGSLDTDEKDDIVSAINEVLKVAEKAYVKPKDGIPESDLSEDLQVKINNQSVSSYNELTDKPSINGVTLKGNVTGDTLGLGTYSKPSGGIPESDLSTEVQEKLNQSGGPAGTTNYNALSNKPSINGVTLSGNKTPAELGLGTYSVPDGGIPMEALSTEVQEAIAAGGSGGTSNYNALINKPSINGHTLIGDLTLEGLGANYYVKPASGIPENDLSAEVQEKLNTSGGIADSETSFVATRDYEAGELIYINGVLYRTKYKILNGTNLIPGNNIEVTDISSEIEKINSDIEALQSGSGPDSWSLVATVNNISAQTPTRFFEYFNAIGGENYNFIVTPSRGMPSYTIEILKRDGTIAYTYNSTSPVDDQKRFTFTPADTGEYYGRIYKNGITDIADLKIELEYTQSQGISELWAQVNKANQVEPRVDALEALVGEQETELDDLKSALTTQGELGHSGQYATSFFVQGFRSVDNPENVIINSTRCTSSDLFHLYAGDILELTGIASGQMAGVYGTNGFSNSWGSNRTVKIDRETLCFVNVAKTSGSSPIQPTDLSIQIRAVDRSSIASEYLYRDVTINDAVRLLEYGGLSGSDGSTTISNNDARTVNYFYVEKTANYRIKSDGNRIYIFKYNTERVYVTYLAWGTSNVVYANFEAGFYYKIAIGLGSSVESLDGILSADNLDSIVETESYYNDGRMLVSIDNYEYGHFNPQGVNVTLSDTTLQQRMAYYKAVNAGKYCLWNPNELKYYILLYSNINTTPTEVVWNGSQKAFFFDVAPNYKYIRICYVSQTETQNSAKLYRINQYQLRESKKFTRNLLFYSREGRGLGVPPASLISIKEAYANGYDGYRFNVCKTSDGHYVLSHDETINNVARNTDGSAITESISIPSHTLAELNEYDYGIQYGSQYAGLKITEFADGAKLCAKLGMLGYVEWKYPNIQSVDFDYLYDVMTSCGFQNSDFTWITYTSYMTTTFKNISDYVNIHYGYSSFSFESLDELLSDKHIASVGTLSSIETSYTSQELKELRRLNVVIENSLITDYDTLLSELEKGANRFACEIKYPKAVILDYAALQQDEE